MAVILIQLFQLCQFLFSIIRPYIFSFHDVHISNIFLLFVNQSKLAERIDSDKCFSKNPASRYRSDHSAVAAVIPVISHTPVFILSQSNLLCCQSRILNYFFSVMFIQNFSVDVNISFFINTNCFSRQTNNTLNPTFIFLFIR